MPINEALLGIPGHIFDNLGMVWTFILLIGRFTGVMSVIPGLGSGMVGLVVRGPAILVFAFVSGTGCKTAELPPDLVIMATQFTMELLFGFMLGMVPLLIVNGIQAGGQFAATAMGLQASQLIDPTIQGSIPDIARIFGDLTILIFLVMGGHHVVFYAASGVAQDFPPGQIFINAMSAELMVVKTADIFRMAIMVSAPVVAALLLTNFVLGLVTKAVPTVNVFIVSFPLTIGIGLVLSGLMLPDVVAYASRELYNIEPTVNALVAAVSAR